MNVNIDNINPKEKWEFNNEVANCFENMLERSIPQYNIMRELVVNICNDSLINTRKSVLDIGCSDGLSLRGIAKNDTKCIGVDISEPMLIKAKERFYNNNNVKIYNHDIKTGIPDGKYGAILSILTIQFIPIEYRQEIIQNIYNYLESNGCFIFVEKTLGSCNNINKLFVEEYLKSKKKNGYTDEQIQRKKLSLEGVLVPVTSNWNKELLRQAGFTKIDTFWKYLNFEGYIAFK